MSIRAESNGFRGHSQRGHSQGTVMSLSTQNLVLLATFLMRNYLPSCRGIKRANCQRMNLIGVPSPIVFRKFTF